MGSSIPIELFVRSWMRDSKPGTSVLLSVFCSFRLQLADYGFARGKALKHRIQELSELLFSAIEDVADVLKAPFEIRPETVIPTDSYRFNRPRVKFSSDNGKRLILS